MPRFIRGGRGLWRKIQSSRGLFSSDEPTNNSESAEEQETISTPKLDLAFKIITAVIILAIIISFSVSCNISANESEQDASTGYLICAICIVLLLLELPSYIFLYRMIVTNYYRKKEKEKLIKQEQERIKNVLEKTRSTDNDYKISKI